MYEIEERKSHIFSIKFQMSNLYIHNLSAMKLTNCVEIKLSAPPTANVTYNYSLNKGSIKI